MSKPRSFLRYVGAKHRLAPVIARYLQDSGATCLVDVFGGSGAVIMNAGFKKRVYNDADGDLVNLFRVMGNPEARRRLLKRLKWAPPSRRTYNEDHAVYVAGGLSFCKMTDAVERARATFYRHTFAYGGKVRSGGFQISYCGRDLIKEVSKLNNLLRRFHDFGQFWMHTVIENLDYQDCVRIYGKNTNAVLFFDPPYVGTESYYSVPFHTSDHTFLAHQLAGCRAPAVGTYYDTPEIRKLYPSDLWDWHIQETVKNSNSNIRLSKERMDEVILVKKTN